MSGDSFKPEEGGEVEVINPDKGNSEIDAQPDDGDAMDAAESEAMEAFTSIDDEAKEEEVESEPVVEDEQAEEDQAEPETQDEEATEEVQAAKWDGNPDHLPEELKETYQSMLRGYHSKNRELSEAQKETQALNAKLTLQLSGEGRAPAEPEGPPPLPTGENVTQEQWNDAVTAQNKYFADQNMKALKESDQFVPASKFAEEQQRAQTDKVVAEVEALPGYGPEVEQVMLNAMATDPFWASAPNSREGMMALADKAIAHVGAQKTHNAQATKAEAKIRKQATAAQRATPRVTTPKGASAEDVFAKQGFKNENERMAAAERIALEEYGG